MTREEVLAMPAGMKMDALVRERVLKLPRASTIGEQMRCYSLFPDCAIQVALEAGLSFVQSEDGYYAGKPTDIEHGHVRGTAVPTLTLHMPEHERWIPANTAPLAICRAALLLTLNAGGAS